MASVPSDKGKCGAEAEANAGGDRSEAQGRDSHPRGQPSSQPGEKCCTLYIYTLIKKKTFLIYKEIQMGSGAKSDMRKGFLMYEEMQKYFHHI